MAKNWALIDDLFDQSLESWKIERWFSLEIQEEGYSGNRIGFAQEKDLPEIKKEYKKWTPDRKAKLNLEKVYVLTNGETTFLISNAYSLRSSWCMQALIVKLITDNSKKQVLEPKDITLLVGQSLKNWQIKCWHKIILWDWYSNEKKQLGYTENESLESKNIILEKLRKLKTAHNAFLKKNRVCVLIENDKTSGFLLGDLSTLGYDIATHERIDDGCLYQIRSSTAEDLCARRKKELLAQIEDDDDNDDDNNDDEDNEDDEDEFFDED